MSFSLPTIHSSRARDHQNHYFICSEPHRLTAPLLLDVIPPADNKVDNVEAPLKLFFSFFIPLLFEVVTRVIPVFEVFVPVPYDTTPETPVFRAECVLFPAVRTLTSWNGTFLGTQAPTLVQPGLAERHLARCMQVFKFALCESICGDKIF